MEITFQAGAFVATSCFADRDGLKRAGWRYRAAGKAWVNRDWRAALKLLGHCDPAARAEIEAREARERESLAASRATDSDLPLPVPEGLSYLPFQRAGIAFALRMFGDLPDAD